MNTFQSMRISASGLSAERLRMDTISSNIANATTTRTENGDPYRRKVAIFEESLKREVNKVSGESEIISQGVKASGVVEDKSPFKRVYNPKHPDADENGYVEMPNVNILNEMVDMMAATRAYEANVTAMNATKNMYMKALQIGR
ncbi:MAG: flagellar basal body rod protein FlgC [Firmicutes bacterium]|nr:flagellar basal body rod protein FlgC [Bacillota bacterium]